MNNTKFFSTWPKKGRPQGWFKPSKLEKAASFYQENGFLVLEDGLSNDEVEAINRETLHLCRNEKNKIEGLPPNTHSSDEEALKRVLCIHFPHKISSLMYDVLSQSKIVDILTRVIGPNVKCMQSMLFIKASGKPGQAWHQDEDFIPTRDRSLIGAWIALDDATIDNGCLWIIPGSHRPGILWKMEWHGDPRFGCSKESRGFPYTKKDEIPVEVKKGSIVFFNGYTLHRSLPNTSKGAFRRSLVNHYMSAESFLPWKKPEDSTSMAMTDYRDIVMVAGEDPYAYKGIEEQAKAFLRPTGEGGCVDWQTKQPLNYSEEKKAQYA